MSNEESNKVFEELNQFYTWSVENKLVSKHEKDFVRHFINAFIDWKYDTPNMPYQHEKWQKALRMWRDEIFLSSIMNRIALKGVYFGVNEETNALEIYLSKFDYDVMPTDKIENFRLIHTINLDILKKRKPFLINTLIVYVRSLLNKEILKERTFITGLEELICPVCNVELNPSTTGTTGDIEGVAYFSCPNCLRRYHRRLHELNKPKTKFDFFEVE